MKLALRTLLVLLALTFVPPVYAVGDETRLVSGCTINLIVTDAPEISGEQIVDDKGEIRFHVGEEGDKYYEAWSVKLLGMTKLEAEDAVAKSLVKFYKNPDVRFATIQFPRKRIDITGPVKKQGALRLPLDARLSDALNLVTPESNADLKQIRILRPKSSNNTDATLAPDVVLVDATGSTPGADPDPILRAGDRVCLVAMPEVHVEKVGGIVNIQGEVEREAAFPIGKAKVKDVILLAGGLKATADRERIMLLRRSDGKHLPLNADKIMEDDPVHNLPVGDGDFIMVMKEDQSQFVSLEGEMNLPCRVPLKDGKTMLLHEAIEKAGGPSKNADHRKGLIRKNYFRDPATARLIPFDYDKLLKAKERDWEIEPGDQIIFPPKVKRPSFLQQVLPLMMRFLPFGF